MGKKPVWRDGQKSHFLQIIDIIENISVLFYGITVARIVAEA